MPPPDYWPDARRLTSEQLKSLVEFIREARDASGYSNAELCRETHAIVAAHNNTTGRTPIHVKQPTDDQSYAELGKYELMAIRNGTRKYVPAYLTWLCRDHAESARRFYSSAGLTFRPYQDTDGAVPALDLEQAQLHHADTVASGEQVPATWSALIAAYAQFSNIDITPLDTRSLSLIDLAPREPLSGRTLRLGEEFCFRLDVPVAGYVIAFQRFRRRWYPLRLSDETFVDHVEPGRVVLPRLPQSDRPAGLSEDEQPGLYGFGFLITSADVATALAAQFMLAAPLPEAFATKAAGLIAESAAEFQVIYRINVKIEA